MTLPRILNPKLDAPVDAPSTEAGPQLSDIHLGVLRDFQDAWVRKDMVALLACVTPNFTYKASVGAEPGTTYIGVDQVRAGVEAMWGIDDGSVASIDDVTVAGDVAVVRWTYTWEGGSGDSRRELGCDVVTFSNGLLATKDAYRKVERLPDAQRPRPRKPSPLDFVVRQATALDCEAMLPLMRELATFEGYFERFAPSVSELQRRIAKPHSAGEFEALVAESLFYELWGYCVFSMVPFTFDLRPTLVIKELFVRGSVRSTGVGGALFAAVVDAAKKRGCGRIKWDVLPGNERAKAFYARFGGHREQAWEAWTLEFEPSANASL